MDLSVLVQSYRERIQDALQLRDFAKIEIISREWLQQNHRDPEGFKWLARSAIAQNKFQRAAYSYGRLLDFDPANKEALQFFMDHPTILQDQPESIRKILLARVDPRPQNAAPTEPSSLVTPLKRKKLAAIEMTLAEAYESCGLYGDAANAYQKSFHWHSHPGSILGAARMLHKNFQSFEATKLLRRELMRKNDWHEGRMQLANLLYELGHKTEAQKEWQTVLRMDPEHREALMALRNHFLG